MLLYVLYAIIGIVALGLALAATKPNSFRIERSAKIDAPADRIMPHLTDFHNWAAWSPWEKLDPALQRSYSGAATGTGAIYEWQGNKKVGKGRMEITEAGADRVLVKLDFIEPFKANNWAEFSMQPAGKGVQLNWAMTGARPFPMKVFSLFMDMDKMVGKDFEQGLAGLKQLSEKPVTA